MIVSDKILVTGGNGMVGHYFSGHPDCVVLGRADFDVTKPSVMRKAIKKYRPKAIVHLAAMTDVDAAQKHPDQAFKTNSIGTYNVATLAKRYGIHLVYVSTGAVFSGKSSKPYTISSQTKPLNTYALSKKMGEEFVMEICEKYSIVRTGWVFGGFDRDKKFVAMIANQIRDGKKEIKAIADTYGCPTYAKDLAQNILTIINEGKYGLFHGVNKGHASRFEIAKVIARTIGEKVRVRSALSKDFPAFLAPRPRFEVIEQNLPLRSWQNALKEYLLDWEDLRNGLTTTKSLLLEVDPDAVYAQAKTEYKQKNVTSKA